MALPPEKIAQLQAAQKTAQDREVNQAKELINAQDIGYTSKLFVQALFPYRKTDEEKRVIETAQGRIVVYADGGLPYGKYPRLIDGRFFSVPVGRYRVPGCWWLPVPGFYPRLRLSGLT